MPTKLKFKIQTCQKKKQFHNTIITMGRVFTISDGTILVLELESRLRLTLPVIRIEEFFGGWNIEMDCSCGSPPGGNDG